MDLVGLDDWIYGQLGGWLEIEFVHINQFKAGQLQQLKAGQLQQPIRLNLTRFMDAGYQT